MNLNRPISEAYINSVAGLSLINGGIRRPSLQIFQSVNQDTRR